METIADLEHKMETEEINPRTGQPYKTSRSVRESKARWAKKHPGASTPYIKNWIHNNRERWNEICRGNQLKARLEHKYLRELFAEALV